MTEETQKEIVKIQEFIANSFMNHVDNVAALIGTPRARVEMFLLQVLYVKLDEVDATLGKHISDECADKILGSKLKEKIDIQKLSEYITEYVEKEEAFQKKEEAFRKAMNTGKLN